MDQIMELTQVSGGDTMMFAVLALLDAQSIGTLALPVVLLLLTGTASGLSARGAALRVLAYLGIIGAFYWVLGVLLLSGLQAFLAPIGELLEGRTGTALLAALGAGLTVMSWWWAPSQIRRRGGDPQASIRGWIERAERVAGSWRGMALLALSAGLVEAATMFPYLVAIAGIGRYEMSAIPSGLLLAGYCLVMILPALLIVVVRLLLGRRVHGLLTKARELAVRTAPDGLSWALGIVGVVLLVNSVPQLLGGWA